VRRLATSEAEFNPVNATDSEGFVS
jgi:hypothetical protein